MRRLEGERSRCSQSTFVPLVDRKQQSCSLRSAAVAPLSRLAAACKQRLDDALWKELYHRGSRQPQGPEKRTGSWRGDGNATAVNGTSALLAQAADACAKGHEARVMGRARRRPALLYARCEMGGSYQGVVPAGVPAPQPDLAPPPAYVAGIVGVLWIPEEMRPAQPVLMGWRRHLCRCGIRSSCLAKLCQYRYSRATGSHSVAAPLDFGEAAPSAPNRRTNRPDLRRLYDGGSPRRRGGGRAARRSCVCVPRELQPWRCVGR